MNVTLKDIAKRASVSIKTVSRVINEEPMVSVNTRQKVKEIIEELGYHPNLIARSLKKRKTNTIGFIIPDIGNPAFTEMVKGCMDYLSKKGYYVFLGSYEDDTSKEIGFIRDLSSMLIDGIIIIPTASRDDRLSIFDNINCPIVFLDREIDGLDVDTVIAGNKAGLYEATKHLISIGHRKLIYLGGIKSVKPSKKRFEGWKRALEEEALFDESNVYWGSYSTASGYSMMNRALDEIKDIDAVFAGNDIIALGALNAIKERRLKVPDDISLVGFDDMFFSKYLNPPLSTVAVKLYKEGEAAARLLHEKIKNPDTGTERIVIPCEFKIRDSIRGK